MSDPRHRAEDGDFLGLKLHVATGLQQCLTSEDGADEVDLKRMEKLFLALA